MSEVKVNKITPTANCGTVTLGDSGDTFSLPAGVTLSNAGSITNSGTITNTGTISGGTITGTISNQVNWDTTAKTTGFTAVAGNGYFVNTTSGAITVTLPATPSAGNLVGIKDYAATAATNNITIDRNGSNIQGTANNFTISVAGTSIILIYVDSTQGWVSTGASKASDISLPFITATGGTITTCGNYKIHTFTSPGTFCVSNAGAGTPTSPSNVDYLVVAGGGGGGSGPTPGPATGHGGGGGAGGYRESSGAASGCYTASPLGACVSALPVSATGYPITVGAGGAGGGFGNGVNGSNSVFSTITSAGGGYGGTLSGNGNSGGSGGGGGQIGPAGGSGNTPPVSPPQGQNGGAPGGPNTSSGGGGGGAGAVGQTGTGSGSCGVGGIGGNGVASSITASPVTRAGGGGGAGSGTPGPGGSGGGGNGNRECAGAGKPSTGGSAGTANTGGGGGAAGNTTQGFTGGSGIVIIRYKYQ